jgi:hypothetical protein
VPLPRHRDRAFGRAEDWSPLSSIFDHPEREPEYNERVRKRSAGMA